MAEIPLARLRVGTLVRATTGMGVERDGTVTSISDPHFATGIVTVHVDDGTVMGLDVDVPPGRFFRGRAATPPPTFKGLSLETTPLRRSKSGSGKRTRKTRSRRRRLSRRR